MQTTSMSRAPLPDGQLAHLRYMCPHCGVTCHRMVVVHKLNRLPCLICEGLADLYVEVNAAAGPVRSEAISKAMAIFRQTLEEDDG